MFKLILFIILCYGLSNALVYADGPFYIFKKYRDFMHKMPSNIGEGTECMICTPFQVGIALSLLNGFVLNDTLLTPMYVLSSNTSFWFIKMLLDGAIASGGTWLLHTLQESLETLENSLNNDIDNYVEGE